jgi:SNF2 family DNA or RNA helicase
MTYSQENFSYNGITLTPVFKTVPYDYQAKMIEWMIHREHTEYHGILGGCQISEMGLGKSFCTLATSILCNDLRAERASNQSDQLDPNSDVYCTLIIVPSQLVYVWKSEIEKHFHNVKYFLYHGSDRKKKFVQYLLDNNGRYPDFIITSFQIIPRDILDPEGIFLNYQFHRIVIDECHYIKHQDTLTWKAIIQLRKNVCWLLSGTLISNYITEMYAHLKLLDYTLIARVPRNDRLSRFKVTVRNTDYTHIQDLMKVIAIRLTKESALDLPEITLEEVAIDMKDSEKEFYRIFKEYSKHRIRKLLRNIDSIRYGYGISHQVRGSLRLIVLQNLLSLIFYLRLACCDQILVINKISRIRYLDIDNAITELRKRDYSDDCPVCFNNIANMRNTDCGHTCCDECLVKLLKVKDRLDSNPICFSCLGLTDPNKWIKIKQDRVIDLDTYTKSTFENKSEKTIRILELVKHELSLGKKVVVVSQWVTYLDKLQQYFQLENPDIPFITLNGKTIPKKRQALVDQFQSDDNIKVAFCSLGSSSVGITMTAASSMIIADIYWNQSAISQMSARIHRISQVNPVHVYTMLVNDSIELKMKELVQKKDAICSVIIEGKPITERTQGWLDKMIRLLD